MRTEQLEMNQTPPAERRGEQEGHLGLGKAERRPLVRHDPARQNRDEQQQRTQGFIQCQVLRRSCRGKPCRPSSPEQMPEKIEIEIKLLDKPKIYTIYIYIK